MLAAHRSGLGATYKVGSNGQVIDCDKWSNITEAVCWTPGGELPQKATPTAPTPDNPGGIQYVPDYPDNISPGPLASGSTSWGTIALVAGAGVVGLLALVMAVR